VHARLGLDGVQLDAPADIRALAVANLRVQAITALTTQTAEDLALGAEQVLQTLRLTDTTLAPLHDALLALIQADQLGKAIEWCDRLIAETVQRRAPGWEGVFCSVRAIICIRQGDLPEAERQARTSLAQLTARGWGVAIGIPLACLLFAVTAMGRYAEAETICAYPVPDAMYQSVYGLYYVQARGYFHLETDRLHAALADFTAVDELLRAWQVDGPNLVAEHTGIAEVYLRMGETDTARSLLERQLAKLGPARSRSRGVSLRLLAATVDLKQRLSLLTEAVEILETCDDQFELARALADLSRAHHGFGESNRARMLLRRASHLAGECQAAPLSRTLVPIMPASPPGDRPSDVLTSAEARVAVLAARGHTNRQIARKLYVTVSTVEQHLTRVYRKLGVDRRSQLPEEIMQAQSVHTA
jgi:DNA-binding CsgD family transcriptional regulator